MYRILALAMGLLLATSVLATSALAAEQAATAPQAGGPATATAAATPAPAPADKVFPPLPSLAMLPPATDDDDEAPPKPGVRKKKSRVQDRKSSVPTARLVVSDASRTYLKGIEKQLDLALAR